MTEEWRVVASSPEYEVSNFGRVRSWKPYHGTPVPRLLRPTINSAGYPAVGLYASRKRKRRTVHSLVAEAFLGPRPAGMEVRHMDGDPQNPHVSNLQYGTRSENAMDAVVHGTHREAKKTHCKQGHPYDEENTYVAKRGTRHCRTCKRACDRRRWHANLLLKGAER